MPFDKEVVAHASEPDFVQGAFADGVATAGGVAAWCGGAGGWVAKVAVVVAQLNSVERLTVGDPAWKVVIEIPEFFLQRFDVLAMDSIRGGGAE